MAVRYAVPANKFAQYDGSNSSEVIEVANSTGFGPFTVDQESSVAVTVKNSFNFSLTLNLTDVICGYSVIPASVFAAEWAEVQLADVEVDQ